MGQRFQSIYLTMDKWGKQRVALSGCERRDERADCVEWKAGCSEQDHLNLEVRAISNFSLRAKDLLARSEQAGQQLKEGDNLDCS